MKQKFVSKLASLTLAVALIVTSVPMTVWAEEATEQNTQTSDVEQDNDSQESTNTYAVGDVDVSTYANTDDTTDESMYNIADI